MHVLIVAQQWAPERGIAQRRMQWMTNALIARGHSVAVLTAPPHYPLGDLLSDQPDHGPYSLSRGPSGELIWRERSARWARSRALAAGRCRKTRPIV